MRRIRSLPVLVLLIASSSCGTIAWCQTQAIQDQIQAERLVLKQSASNLRQIGLAMHNYHDTHKSFPAAAIYDQNGKALLSWRVALLPYLEDEPIKLAPPDAPRFFRYRPLYKQFKLDEPWDSDHNKKLLDQMPDVFKSPAAKGKTNQTYYQVLTGPDTVFAGTKGMKLTQITDGTSNTILAVEAAEAVPWTKPADVAYDAQKPLPRFGGIAKSGFHILVCDGSTRLVRPDFIVQTFRAAITPAGGEVADWNKLSR